jgi:hypothetical protein
MCPAVLLTPAQLTHTAPPVDWQHLSKVDSIPVAVQQREPRAAATTVQVWQERGDNAVALRCGGPPHARAAHALVPAEQ